MVMDRGSCNEGVTGFLGEQLRRNRVSGDTKRLGGGSQRVTILAPAFFHIQCLAGINSVTRCLYRYSCYLNLEH